MFSIALERRVQQIALLCTFLMTLVVTPWLSLDPINVPKFLTLVTCAFASIGYCLPSMNQLFKSEARLLAQAIGFFCCSLIIVSLVSDSGVWADIYGEYGRNTGLLTYMGLAWMLLAVCLVSSPNFLRKLLWLMVATGNMNALYGLVQWFGKDPIDWSNPYNPIIGTFGNSNFISSYLGITSLVSAAFLFEKSQDFLARTYLLGNIGLSIFVISVSHSSQGIIIFMLGLSLLIYFRFLIALRFTLRIGYLFGVGIGLVLGLLGVLNSGPLATLLYQDSVTYRGDYWRAGWRMTLDNPVFGVGLDAYGDWYRASRNEDAVLRRGPEIISNSAHNVFLDFSSNGGLFLLIAYLLIVGLVLKSATRLLLRLRHFDAIGMALVSAWLGYMIQSFISINQLGLAIWGWTLGGAIIGYDFYQERHSLNKSKFQSVSVPEQISAATLLRGTLGVVFGFLISFWPLGQDMSFMKALESGDATKIELAAKQFPQNDYYYVYAGRIFLSNGLNVKALELTRLAIDSNPRLFEAWKLLMTNPNSTQTEKDSSILEMRKLDPFNLTLDD